VKVWRVVPLDRKAEPESPGGALWIARHFQGAGRHDNPETYGCMYLSENPVSAIAEHLSPFRGTGQLLDSMLTKIGLPLTLITIELGEEAELLDLDDPAVLGANSLKPSRVATRHRNETQTQAATLFENHPAAAGLRWWSTLEASWINLTIFDRGQTNLEVIEITTLAVTDPFVNEAAEFMGLRI